MVGPRNAVENANSTSGALKILERKTDEIEDALDVYDRFIEEELYNSEDLPSEIDRYLAERDIDYETGFDAAIRLATDIAIEADELQDAFDHTVSEKQNINIDYQEMWDEVSDLRETYQRARKAGVDPEDPSRKTPLEDIPDEASIGKIIHEEIREEDSEGQLDLRPQIHHSE